MQSTSSTSIINKSSNLSLVNKRFYSTSIKNTVNLLPNWVTGFCDGESSFSVSISKNDKYKTGFYIIPAFAIELNDKDILLLYRIQRFLG